MAGVMESVDQHTRLAGQNRLELLLFRLGGSQIYGINVFKVKEVLPCPSLTVLPQSCPSIRGVAHIRGRTISILDLGAAIGFDTMTDTSRGFIIITEYNCVTQGFLVSAVERIINMNWEEIHPPPGGSGRETYLTAVSEVGGQLIEILDVERVLAEVTGPLPGPTKQQIENMADQRDTEHHALIIDDSSMARSQMRQCCEELGVQVTLLNDGRQAYDHLIQMLARGEDPVSRYALVISDIEMPEMDGYTLTASIKTHPQLEKLHVLLHTSLSGGFNRALVDKVGADDFLAKYRPDELGERIAKRLAGDVQESGDQDVNLQEADVQGMVQ